MTLLRRLAAILLTLLALPGCDHGKTGSVEQAPPIIKGVVLETVKSKPLADSLEVTGTIRARVSAIVSARIPGSITELHVREGDRVRKGQLLARLEAVENAAQAAAASAGIDDARQALDEAVSRQKLADVTFERYRNLFTEQAVTRQEFDVKKSEQELAYQGVGRAKARLRQAREGSRAAATMAGYTRITAPVSGIITSKQADLGSNVFPGQQLLTIEDQGSYQLELAVPESFASSVIPGTTVQVSLDTLDKPFGARISEVVPSSDPASHTFIAKITLAATGLRSGMFGRADISLENKVNSILVPKTGVVERGSMTFVWVAGKDNVVRMRLVKVGRNVADRVIILSGLSDGERVAVGGLEKIQEGAKVE